MSDKDFDLEHLRHRLDYNPNTGKFKWKNGRNKGKQAGHVNGSGYRYIQVNGRHSFQWRAHRLAWYMHYGVMPPEILDHINCVKDDNRISNLREADYTTNQYNVQRRNTTNIYKHETSGRWRVRVWVRGIRKHLGYFDTIDEAAKIRDKFLDELHGEFRYKGI